MDVEKVIREYIDRTVHMSLATSRDGQPWVCEVHFTYDEGLNLYFRSLASRRHSQEIAENPRVAGDIIDKYDLGETVVGVYFEGRASMVTDRKEIEKITPHFIDRLNQNDSIIEEALTEDGHKMYKITVTGWCVFGRFGQPSGQKYQLKWND
ncbi:pyridoxamine 5'-phosphate oxidase family protein [Candidatus Saccharibacteria bacterium]|nr:pyridoxamine 5'-phosphate oxidase family protein [Candidatus Saccharibacteria bacterium]